MRLIDADKLTKNLTYDIANHPIHGNFKITVASVRAAISNAPVIDAVPVVRCKECWYYQNAKLNKKGFLICPASGMEITEDDYCSYGERKEDNT